jgi:hypothetical protein
MSQQRKQLDRRTWTTGRDKKNIARDTAISGTYNPGGADLRWFGRRTRKFIMLHDPGHHAQRFSRFCGARWPQTTREKSFEIYHGERKKIVEMVHQQHGTTWNPLTMAIFIVVISKIVVTDDIIQGPKHVFFRVPEVVNSSNRAHKLSTYIQI